MKKFLSLFLVIIMCLSAVSCGNNSSSKGSSAMHKVTKVHDYVYEVETHKEIDYDFAEAVGEKIMDGWRAACTAVAKYTDDGKMLVGRNMDLYISNKPAYIIKTEAPGKYKTYGLSYFNKGGPDNSEVLAKGSIDNDYYRMLPFLCEDVFNEKGLYIETNMRNGEYWATGKSEYGCDGTNPDGIRRICSGVLPRYLGEHCATVEEAVAAAKELDIYTPTTTGMDWNFCFMMADNTGNYGLLEIAQNKISWLPKQPAQANFYITPEFAITEDLASGKGRYDLVMQNRNNVKNENDMYDLIRRVSYSKIYDPANCEFDVRTEFVALRDYLTYDVMTYDEIKEAVYQALIEFCEPHFKKTRQELQDESNSWESTFTEVVNCTDKTWFIRFFEDESRTIKLQF